MRTTTLVPLALLAFLSLGAKAQNITLDNCDDLNGWSSLNQLSLNTADVKEGKAALRSTGDQKLEFTKVFPPLSTNSSVEKGAVQFWYYVSDVSKLDEQDQIELSSSGQPDKNEYNWSVGKLSNGWNLITKTFRSARTTGGEPDLQAINFIRIYHAKNGPVTTMIDGLQIIK